jgi:hypothetical protein
VEGEEAAFRRRWGRAVAQGEPAQGGRWAREREVAFCLGAFLVGRVNEVGFGTLV